MIFDVSVSIDDNSYRSHKETKIFCTPYDQEVDLTFNGTPDEYTEIPEREGFGSIIKGPVELIFCLRKNPREKFNEAHGVEKDSAEGIGELWIQRLEDGNSLMFTTYIAFEAADYLRSLTNFKIRFEFSESPLRQNDHGDAYLIEYAFFTG